MEELKGQSFHAILERSHAPLVTVGMPVFNGEKFIKRAIDSLINQTFKDIKIIISDNESTDSTRDIVLEHFNLEPKVQYIRQSKNQGLIRNFEFVLKSSRSPYFMWAAVDDVWHPTFIEKNLEILAENPKLVGSISKVKMECLSDKNPLLLGTYSIYGSYPQRLRKLFRCLGANSRFYGLYRHNFLLKSFVSQPFVGGMDGGTLMKVLSYGDFHELDEVLMERSCDGISNKSLLSQLDFYGHQGFSRLFPMSTWTIWFWMNFDLYIFLICLDRIIRYNIFFSLIVISELLQIRRKHSSKT